MPEAGKFVNPHAEGTPEAEIYRMSAAQTRTDLALQNLESADHFFHSGRLAEGRHFVFKAKEHLEWLADILGMPPYNPLSDTLRAKKEGGKNCEQHSEPV